ncbi:N-acetyltransferase GCN5 [Mycobacterium xenopi RIVM700367]|uniref:GNAT family N-acetyltransferase n=1 Tax=Mycobacterium xenopi TaxID=1789 RepID=UPI00025AEFCB|nr:GNAT family N-acetyltransferase [Mycobacterium xenopi]EID10965.1 N-acetyltransferase GCN5 [Mycobacterium xenopi RIVM700367]
MGQRCLDRGDTVRLLDGSEIRIRRLSAPDTAAVIELHRQLTDRERYFRFFVAYPAYLTTFAKKVVRCNRNQWALGAFDSGQLIGVANYVVTDQPDVAEVAVAVAHKDHLRGVATALLKQLAEVALGNGIHTFTADVLAGNTAMLKVLSDAGWRRTVHFDGPVLRIEINLRELADKPSED